jgi:hypothetical protein
LGKNLNLKEKMIFYIKNILFTFVKKIKNLFKTNKQKRLEMVKPEHRTLKEVLESLNSHKETIQRLNSNLDKLSKIN